MVYRKAVFDKINLADSQ